MTDLHLPEWRVVAVREGIDPRAASGWYVRAATPEEAVRLAREAGMLVPDGDDVVVTCRRWKEPRKP